MEQKNIYHYTTLKSLISIIENGEFWLTRIDYMNDFSEFYYIVTVLNKAFENYDKALFSCDPEKVISNRDTLIAFRNKNVDKYYSMSFCNNPDSIPMWLNYSSIDGVAIGVNLEVLNEILQDITSPYLLRNASGNINYSEKSLLDKCTVYINDLNYYTLNEPKYNFNMMSHFFDFWKDTLLFKDKMFTYEDEYRLLLEFIGEPNFKINFRESGEYIKPYFKFRLSEHPKWEMLINSVIISPLNNSDLVIRSIKEFLTLKYSNNDIEIRISNAPLRHK